MNLRKWRLPCSASVLFVLYMVVPIAIRLMSGTPHHAVGTGLDLLWRTIGLCVLLCLFVLYESLLHNVLPPVLKNGVARSVLVLLPAFLIGGRTIFHSLPSVRAAQILESAELSALPESATEITVYAWWTPMSGEEYLAFRASHDDIELFVGKSPILKAAERRDYSRAKMRLLDGERVQSTGAEYIRHHRTAAPWYMEEIRWRARRYRIRPKGYHHEGEVIIDQENDIVFVKLVFSWDNRDSHLF